MTDTRTEKKRDRRMWAVSRTAILLMQIPIVLMATGTLGHPALGIVLACLFGGLAIFINVGVWGGSRE